MVARAKGRPSWVPQSIDAAALGEQGSSSDFDKTSHGFEFTMCTPKARRSILVDFSYISKARLFVKTEILVSR